MVASRPRNNGDVSVVIQTSNSSSHSATTHSQRRPASANETASYGLTRQDGQQDEDGMSRIPYASKGKWKAGTNGDLANSDEEYLAETLVEATIVSTTSQRGARQSQHLTFTQTRPRKSNGTASSKSARVSQASRVDTTETLTASFGKKGASSTRPNDIDFAVDAVRTYEATPPPPAGMPPIPLQAITDRPPPTPPPFPEEQLQPWYMLYAPQVAWVKLDKKETQELKQDIDGLSEASQARTNASKVTPTSTGGLSRTPSKNRMRMVPAGQRERSRSRRPSHDSDYGPDRADGLDRRSASPTTSEDTVEVTSASSSESDTDREETDGTDSDTEEILEFKRVTRKFADIRYPGARTSSSVPIIINAKKRKPLLEDMLPDTYGPKHTSTLSRIMVEGSKPGRGPRAVARKSFARAIGSRLLARRRDEAK
ncbi:hypothetical protein P389DRAFT_211264 [Cystobasidium minutum MCA 4210]|uniref:uncharacterized protein n=1 Tax=Cystobasidium minutum MCA 4210 TaxID=1397322 RepID=UPI0034CFB99D|eukprot:jgi/Rhomi1/211264/estExt_Genemark1.C_4_t20423